MADTEQLSLFEEENTFNYDLIDENGIEKRCKLGDIWQLGEHRLMCGDSTDEQQVNILMDGNKADMVFTDPPYGMKYQSNARTNKFNILANDDVFLDIFPIIKKNNNGFVFICTTWKVLDVWINIFKKYYELTNMIIWNKGGGGMGDLTHTFNTDYEIILCSNNEKKILGKRLGSVWTSKKDNTIEYLHPTQKPIKLSSMAINETTRQNEIVLDLFGGSGSTLIACELLKRKCYMMELDPHYCDVIIHRWEKITRKLATKIKNILENNNNE